MKSNALAKEINDNLILYENNLPDTISDLKDFITVTAIEIGKELLPQAKALATQILNIFEANRKLIKGRFVKFLIGKY